MTEGLKGTANEPEGLGTEPAGTGPEGASTEPGEAAEENEPDLFTREYVQKLGGECSLLTAGRAWEHEDAGVVPQLLSEPLDGPGVLRVRRRSIPARRSSARS